MKQRNGGGGIDFWSYTLTDTFQASRWHGLLEDYYSFTNRGVFLFRVSES